MSVSISTERNVKSVVQLPLCEMNVTCFEQCSFCKTAGLHGRNARECHRELVEVLRNNVVPYQTVARWPRGFLRGRVATSDQQRTWRPVSVRTDVVLQ